MSRYLSWFLCVCARRLHSLARMSTATLPCVPSDIGKYRQNLSTDSHLMEGVAFLFTGLADFDGEIVGKCSRVKRHETACALSKHL